MKNQKHIGETDPLTDEQAKQRLIELLRSNTAGSILHLLAQVYQDLTKKAKANGFDQRVEQLTLVEATLIVVGYGVDVVCPN